MKRFFSLLLCAGIALAGAATAPALVRAQANASMTEAHIQRIRSNCIEAQTSLTQLHASDALLRVNRGQIYESILTKLMTPFNGRLALNKLDNAALTTVTSQYERALSSFRSNYQQYEEAMSRTLKITCTNQPVAFYDSVTETRSKRQLVHDSTVQLQQLIQAYQAEFDAFSKKFQESHR